MALPGAPRSVVETMTVMAQLTTAQHALLDRIAAHDSPVTIAELAAEAELHVSSVRETLEALNELGLVVSKPMPISGRGRPAVGYLTYTPTDLAFFPRMLVQSVTATLSWLTSSEGDAAAAARDIGRTWGDVSLDQLGVPPHDPHTPVPDFSLENHMGKIRLFMTSMGFAASPDLEDPLAFWVNACPYWDPENPNPLALELRRGLIERVLERTAIGRATWDYEPDGQRPLAAKVTLQPVNRETNLAVTVRFFGGAAEAAGADSIEVELAEPTSVDEVLARVAHNNPSLQRVLAVSSLLLDERPGSRDARVGAGSQIDVLPPFAGG